MYYVFDKLGKFIASSDNPLDNKDLKARSEFYVDCDKEYEAGEKFYDFKSKAIKVKGLSPSPFHIWNGTEWIINKQDELKTMKPLTQRQFKMALVVDFKISETVATKNIKTSANKDVLMVEWVYATYFLRANENIVEILTLLGFDDEDKINNFWNIAKGY